MKDAMNLFSSEELKSAIDSAYKQCQQNSDGNVANYIPELLSIDAELFSIAVCTVDGKLHTAGDSEQRFSMQSMCKPFLFWEALSAFGEEQVRKVVGVEPSGEPYDSFIRLESSTHRPHNPMMNAGAIAIANLLAQDSDDSMFLEFVRRLAGNANLQMDMPVYLSERDFAHRNRAIACLLQHVGIIGDGLECALDFYLRACSVSLNCSDLAVIGATLANGGINPKSTEMVISNNSAREVLTVMMTCGMYDGSGQFAFDVGIPAKSGVSGGIVAVIPKRAAIAIYSPRLDKVGNSVRGVSVLRELSDSLDFHMFQSIRNIHDKSSQTTSVASIEAALREAFEKSRKETGGALASYAPELASVNPELFGAAVCFVDGQVVVVGDAKVKFALQSVANPFTYAFALSRLGTDLVHEKVGVEPSGNPFDAIVFDPVTLRPFNPLNNAGAITIASLIPGADASSRLKVLLNWLFELAGVDTLELDSALLRSEERAGYRNRAIAHLLRSLDIIEDVDAALELYFQQCSIQLTCQELSRMAAVLAAGGRSPVSAKQLLDPKHARHVLSTMFMSGIHDNSGRFAYEIGVPAKSGISGALAAVVPGRFGICIYSPRVDLHGTSVRGRAFLKHFVRSLKLGLFDVR